MCCWHWAPCSPTPARWTARRATLRESLFSGAVVRRSLFLGGRQAAGVTAAFFWCVNTAGLPFSDFTVVKPVYREAITMVQAGIVISQEPGILLICAISYVPLLQRLFHTAALSVLDWSILVGCGVLLLLAADEIHKVAVRARIAQRPEAAGRSRYGWAVRH
jgi:P-type Ca2+ transporter type 2C